MEADSLTLAEKIIEVGDGHKLYSQLWGRADAEQTIVFLHGGPGGGCSDSHKQLFDPAQQRVIFFDQRGCGKSQPYGSIKANQTDNLVDDISAVTQAYNTDTFVITGGSWGSCLGLVYAIRHPEKVIRLVLRGIFTGRASEIDFMDQGDVKAFFPDVWERFLKSVPNNKRANPRKYHMDRLFGDDADAAKRSAMAYSELEVSLISLDDRRRPVDLENFDPVPITIECHYLVNNCFIPEGYIIDNAAKLMMPIALVQGRYDAVCPPITAYELHKALPNSQLYWTIAGHSGSDRSNADLTKVLLSNLS